MRAFVDAKAFSDTLGKVYKVLQKSTVPVLEGVLVRFEKRILHPDRHGFHHLADGKASRPG